ncbi:hypothetical protein ACOSQ3_001724 [Xanthoceras sorbifolium]
MENSQIIMKEKLEFSGMIKEALKIPFRNPNFILFFLLASFSLFFFLVLYEIIFLQSLIQTVYILVNNVPSLYGYFTVYGFSISELIENVSQTRLLSSLLLFGIIHLLDLLNTIIIVYAAAVMYAGEPNPMNLKQILCTPIEKVGFKGPLITSIYALLLALLTLLGLLSLAMNLYLSTDNSFLILIFGVPFMALLIKHIEWSGIWNMGMVISILEGKHGDVAIGVSAYLSRGCRKSGFRLASVFFAWKIASRLLCFYYVQWHNGRIGLNVVEVIAGKVCLDCVGNMIMWVGFVVYFYDCKKRFLEKKFDGPEERVAQTAQV